MSNISDTINPIWSEFPEDFKETTLSQSLDNLQNDYQEKKQFFDDCLKIAIMGKVSTGKSTLINTFLGHEYFPTTAGEGTPSYFYCSNTDKDNEYFTVNDDDVDRRNINLLRIASKKINIGGYIDYKTVIKAYVNKDKYQLLQRKTVIIDCPGFLHNKESEKELKKHCNNADLLIFMFDIQKTATEMPIEDIKNIRGTFYNPPSFFVYNKCDCNEFNINMETSLKNIFSELFGSQYAQELQINYDPLYFISANNPDSYPDFSRLVKDILRYKDISLIRRANIQSNISNNIKNFPSQIIQFISTEKARQVSLTREINQLKFETDNFNRSYPSFIRCLTTIIDECRKNSQTDKVFDIILKEIHENRGKCNKTNAFTMISNIGDSIDQKIIEFIEGNLKSLCIDPIDQKFKEFINENLSNLQNNQFEIPRNVFHIPTVKNLSFWWFEFGDKTDKTKSAYKDFINTKTEEINKLSLQFYNSQLSRIKMDYEDTIDRRKRKYSEENTKLNNDLRKLETGLERLVNYKNIVDECVNNYCNLMRSNVAI